MSFQKYRSFSINDHSLSIQKMTKMTFDVRYGDGLSGLKTTIMIHEEFIECPLTPDITFKALNQIRIDNSAKDENRGQSFKLKHNNIVFNFMADNIGKRDEILSEILNRIQADDINRAHWKKAIQSERGEVVLKIDRESIFTCDSCEPQEKDEDAMMLEAKLIKYKDRKLAPKCMFTPDHDGNTTNGDGDTASIPHTEWDALRLELENNLEVQLRSKSERLHEEALRLEHIQKEVDKDRDRNTKMMEEVRREKDELDREKEQFAAKRAVIESNRKSLINEIQEERRKLIREQKNEMERMQHLRKVIKQERDELEREKEAFAQKRSAVESERRKLKLQTQEMEDAHCKLMEQVQRERDKALEIKERDSEMVIRQRHKLRKEAERLREIQKEVDYAKKQITEERCAMDLDAKNRKALQWKQNMESLRWKNLKSSAKRMRDELKLEQEEFRKDTKLKESKLESIREGLKRQKRNEQKWERKERILRLEAERLKRFKSQLEAARRKLNKDRSEFQQQTELMRMSLNDHEAGGDGNRLNREHPGGRFD